MHQRPLVEAHESSQSRASLASSGGSRRTRRPLRPASRLWAQCLAHHAALAGLLLTAALLTAGCGAGGSVGGEGWVVRDSAGITIVENDPARPALGENAWRLAPEPILRIGRLEGDDAESFYRVADTRRLADGTIAVANASTAEIRLFDADGRYLRTVGRRGEGPGELRSPSRISETAGDTLLVVAPFPFPEVSVFAPDGMPVRRFAIDMAEAPTGVRPYPVGRFADGTLLFVGSHPPDPSWTGIHRTTVRMMRYGLDGTLIGSLGEFDGSATAQASRVAYVFGPSPRYAVTDSTFWYGPGDRVELREVSREGRLRRIVRMDRPPRPVTRDDIALYRETFLERARGTPSELAVERTLASAEYAGHYPAHADLLTDDAGNLWVRNYQSFADRAPQAWVVFGPDGRYLSEVEMPRDLTVHHIGEDFVLGVWMDPLEVEFIHMYRLEKGGD